jgi:hypothetical protein
MRFGADELWSSEARWSTGSATASSRGQDAAKSREQDAASSKCFTPPPIVCV